MQAVEAFKKNKYDVILMDLHMPVCNGLDATRQIRVLEGGNSRIPIIAVTASVADEPICSQAGMDDFIPKPINKTSFLAKVEKWTKNE